LRKPLKREYQKGRAMQKYENSSEQKLARAARLIKGVALQFEQVGLKLDFKITIKAQRPMAFTTGRRIFIKDKLSPLKQTKK